MLLFSGEFKNTVDSKGRISIPAVFRNQLSDESWNTFHITIGSNKNLTVYPREVFIHVASNWEKSYGSLATPEEQRRFLLDMMANAQPTRCDQQGRIIVPKKHLDYAKIVREVTIIGMVTKIEFWNPDMYADFMRRGMLTSQERLMQFGGADKD
ncbi:MAG: hypothetical protein ABIL68_14925 [bacterium]